VSPARRALLGEYLIYVVFVGICLALAILIRVREGSWVFVSQRNLILIGVQTIPYALLAVGMTFVILTAGIDLSVGGIIAFSGVLGAIALTRWSVGVAGAIAVGLAAGMAAGAANGLMITRFNIPPFIATLAMWLITGYTGGIAFLLNDGRPVWNLPDRFVNFFIKPVFGVQPIVPLIAAAVVVGHLVLARTRFGRNIYAVGGNEEAARLSGINVRQVKLLAYVISGACAGLTAMVMAARLRSGAPTTGPGSELDAIAAVVVGGTSLFGGKGSMPGTLVGILILSALNNGLQMLGISSYWQPVFRGSVIVLAVLIDQLTKRARG
jgi:ribose/xylose/arabinose/galactoside ABC-type transport system permease subunit